MKIGKVIFDKLSNDSSLNGLGYASNIYPAKAQQGTAYPYIVYKIDMDDPVSSKSTSAGSLPEINQMHVEIEIYNARYDNIVDSADAVIKALNRFSGTNSSVLVDTIQYLDTDDDYDKDEDVYIRTITFRTRVKN
tara:strand:+ start:896 stop:1300 length:405 start_codon:yes stop_codon:yes gene_type:complete